MIQVENLTKYYGEYAAIENVSFAVEKGEILGFLGPNAAGKTTTMRILTGFLQPTSGKAAVAGFDVVSESLEARKRIGYLPENVPLYDDMTPRSYLQYAARLKGVESRQVNKRVEEVMEATRITDHAEVLISKLSKGYRQRVGLAQALIHNPDVLILDEPTVGLDPNQIVEIRQLIKGLGGDRTIILSTHILPEVEMLCGRIVIIHEGKVAAMDTPDNLALRLRRAQQIGVHVRGPEREVQAKLAALPGVLRVQVVRAGDSVVELLVDGEEKHDVREALASAIVSNGWGLRHMAEVGMSLEEIFRQLTSEEKGVAA
ncbi:MAG TPA: ATP-binding cassette domain-containing protein [Armatimonadota bacterium]|nr:ATP-binding cassette domain-containing protein [Armatimonadota bacterium]HOJ20138.1 ATP-binding cassette domain-containing protein [Armatimonadota bacterium]HOM80545.1 ATP-binding cassette domain-containing protein [Armatimonadota bacterium]HPO71410.1 ATP-binding cassette domain-containing protein [Armatimonadota bacterium]HPT97774.1 ATP-binding cassette domain-containing protein [Armatimonadota bacterium]